MHIEINDCSCPVCGSPELNEETGLLNVRGFKVHDETHGWWSECLVCKAKYGNGWFVFSEQDNCYVLEEAFGRGFAAEGGNVTFISQD